MKDFVVGFADIIVTILSCLVLATGVLSGLAAYGILGAILGAFGSLVVVTLIFGYWVLLSSINDGIKKLVLIGTKGE